MKAAKGILVPVDFSDSAIDALEWGATLAQYMGAKLFVLTVLEPSDQEVSSAISLNHRQSEARLRDCFEEELYEYLPWLAGNRPEILIRVGRPVSEILKVAREKSVDFIAMGAHGRQGIVRTAVGSVADGVIRGATIPVILSHASTRSTSILKRSLDEAKKSFPNAEQADLMAKFVEGTWWN